MLVTLVNNIQLNPDGVQPLQYDEIPTTCPCCDHVVYPKTNSISFDYWKGLVFKGDIQIHLMAMEADLLKILLDSWPKICSREKILVGLYGGSYSERVYSDNIGVQLSRLRSKIKIFDIEIQNIKCRGWWLVKQSKEPLHKLAGKRD